MYRYCVIVEQLTSEDGKPYYTYGIRLRGRKVKVSDVTTQRSIAKHIVSLCNISQVPPKKLNSFVSTYLDI